MKKKFLDYSIKKIVKKNRSLSEMELSEIRYGLESFYLITTKTIIIIFTSLLLNITIEMLLLLLFFNIVRLTGFGLHLSNSWLCLLFSSCIFLVLPILAKLIIIPILIKYLLFILSIILIYIYAPSDTEKRPLLNHEKRKKLKHLTLISVFILNIISIVLKNHILSNLIIFGIYIEIFTLLPITYMLFNLKYNNYIAYIKEYN